MDKAAKREPCIGALDIEMRGMSNLYNGINAIGICVIHAESAKILFQRRYCLQPIYSDQKFDPDTKKEFWDKHDMVLKTIEREAVPVSEALEAFLKDKQHHDTEYDVVWVGDYVAFDYAQLQSLIDQVALIYRTQGHAMPPTSISYDFPRSTTLEVVDLGSLASGALGYNPFRPVRMHHHRRGTISKRIFYSQSGIVPTRPKKARQAQHDHLPDEDAMNIALYAFDIGRYCAQRLCRSKRPRLEYTPISPDQWN